ncbi:MAG: TetR/AcrR family transcriptional regulator [Anaerolineaceae bacterium]|nr:TetR/AcrR family transcriptional regulator [Anaerolineaceae bacterium]
MKEKPINLHQQQRLKTYKHLQSISLELLLENGYDDLSVQDITKRAGLGRGTFYIHFKDKADVVWSLIQETLEDAREQGSKIRTTQPAMPVEFFSYYNTFLHANKHKDQYLIMFGSLGSAELSSRAQRELAEQIVSQMKVLNIYRKFSGPKEVVASIVVGAFVRALVWWLENPNELSAENMAVLVFENIHHRKPPPIS